MALVTGVQVTRDGRWHRVHCLCGRETLTLEKPKRVECYKCRRVMVNGR